MKRSGYKKLTGQEYDKIKALIPFMSVADITKFTGRSNATISYIKRTNSYDHYREVVSEAKKQARLQKEQQAAKAKPEVSTEVEHTDTAVATKSESTENKFDRTVLALNRIGDQLERLADAWEQNPKKRGLF